MFWDVTSRSNLTCFLDNFTCNQRTGKLRIIDASTNTATSEQSKQQVNFKKIRIYLIKFINSNPECNNKLVSHTLDGEGEQT